MSTADKTGFSRTLQVAEQIEPNSHHQTQIFLLSLLILPSDPDLVHGLPKDFRAGSLPSKFHINTRCALRYFIPGYCRDYGKPAVYSGVFYSKTLRIPGT